MCDGPMESSGAENVRRLNAALTVEDHGNEFYLVSEGDGHDLTLSLEAPVAERLAEFILARRARRHADGVLGADRV